VIVDGDRAVIDWAYSAAGDIRADLARRRSHSSRARAARADAPAAQRRAPPALRLALGYERRRPMPDYRPYRAWACAMMLRGTIETMGRPALGDRARPDRASSAHRSAVARGVMRRERSLLRLSRRYSKHPISRAIMCFWISLVPSAIVAARMSR
jgi:aminoglycoside phosphotransferase (APT) family kinase protein